MGSNLARGGQETDGEHGIERIIQQGHRIRKKEGKGIENGG